MVSLRVALACHLAGRPTRPLRRHPFGAAALLLLVAAVACSPARLPPDADAAPGATTHPTPPELYSIEITGDPASLYDTETTAATPLSSLVSSRYPGIAVSACLQRAARAHANLPSGFEEHVPLAFTEFALHWAGCPDPTATLSVLLTDRSDPSAMLDRLAPVLQGGGFTHLGSASSPARPPYSTRWFVLLIGRRMSMLPVATSASPGAQLPLQFRLDASYPRATVAVTTPRGVVETIAVGVSSGWAVAGVALAEEFGTQWIELIGHGPSGPEVLALFPVEIGREPGRHWVGRPAGDESWVDTTDEAESLAAQLVADDRSRFGLGALSWDPELAAIARAHSAEMAERGYFAHVSPRTGNVADRLRHAGYPASFAAENIAMAPTLGEAQESLMRSPGHRAAVLTPEATHLGIGVVTRSDPRLGTVHHLTQLFVRRESTLSGG